MQNHRYKNFSWEKYTSVVQLWLGCSFHCCKFLQCLWKLFSHWDQHQHRLRKDLLRQKVTCKVDVWSGVQHGDGAHHHWKLPGSLYSLNSSQLNAHEIIIVVRCWINLPGTEPCVKTTINLASFFIFAKWAPQDEANFYVKESSAVFWPKNFKLQGFWRNEARRMKVHVTLRSWPITTSIRSSFLSLRQLHELAN